MTRPEPQNPAELSDRFTTVLYAVVRQIRRLRLKDPVDRATLVVLAGIAEHGQLRPSEVASAVDLDLSTISRHVRALDRDGLLTRVPDPADRRACRLTLTPAGEEVLRQARARRVAALGAAVTDWEPADLAVLTALLDRFTTDLIAAGDPGQRAGSPPAATETT